VGGTTGQVLTKIDATNYNTNWQTPSPGLTLPLSQNLTWASDNTYDIGLTGSQRPRTAYFGTSVNTPSVLSSSILALAGTSGINLQAAGTNRWNIGTAGHLTAFVDNVYDIGASGANRPRTAYLGTSVLVGPSLTIDSYNIGGGAGNLRVGTYSATTLTLFSNNVDRWTLTTAGHFVAVTDNSFDIGASGATRPRDVFLGRNLAVGGTVGLNQLSVPTVLISGKAQASAGSTYGFQYLNAAGSANLFYTRDDGVLFTLGPIWVGNSGGVIKTPVNSGSSLSIEAPNQYLMLSSKSGSHLIGNAYYDGTNWQRFDVAQALALVVASPGGISFSTAPAGANPASPAQRALLDQSGNFSATGSIIAGATGYLGMFQGTPAWSSSTINTWLETAVQLTVTVTGKMCRVDWMATFSNTVDGAIITLAFGLDGAVQFSSGTYHQPGANRAHYISGSWYVQPAAGSHRFALFINFNSGTLTLSQSVYNFLQVTEIRT
jgi:hypothetical protein